MTTKRSIQHTEYDTVTVNKIKYDDNTKGNILVTKNGSVMYSLPVGTEGQILTVDTFSTGGLTFVDPPTGPVLKSTITFNGGIRLVPSSTNSGTSYTIFNNHTTARPPAEQPVASNVEGYFVPGNAGIKKLQIWPSSNATWPASTDITFTVGTMTGLGGIGPPDGVPLVGVGVSFIPYTGVGCSVTADSTFNSTRNVLTSDVMQDVALGDFVCVRAVNAVNVSGVDFTVGVWIQGTF